jgi:predicted ester cyclase
MKRTFSFLLLTLVSPLVSQAVALSQATPPSPPASASEEARNEALARRVFDEIFNQGRFDAANEIYAPDFVNHGLHRNAGLAEDQAAVRWEKSVLPDLRITVDLMTAHQDYVTVVWTARGSNTGRAGWIPATGAHIEERGITVWRILDGRIHDEWTSFDELRLARQVAQQLWWVEVALVVLLLLLDWGLSRLVGRLWAIARQPKPAG